MKKIKSTLSLASILTFLILLGYQVNAQTTGQKIGTNPTMKDASAVLELEAANKGVLMPRVELTSTADNATVPMPAQFLTVFNTKIIADVTKGYYYWDTNKWVRMLDTNSATSSGWALLGNATTDPTINFLGTTDDADLKFRVNNKQIGWFTSDLSDNTSSIFLGEGAGIGSTYTSNAFFVGQDAGLGAYGPGSNFIGFEAGYQTNASNSNFIGASAGALATYAVQSNFIGVQAGVSATDAHESNFMGLAAGSAATNANNSVFIGAFAGYSATYANSSVFLGSSAGNEATNAISSNFIGSAAGQFASNATHSTFIGEDAGNSATNAANSIFIGNRAGNNNLITDASTQSILIGNNTSTGGFINSIGLGTGAINTAVNQLMIGNSAGTLYDIVNPKYPETRTDVVATTPKNFLYTDDKGMFLSAPVSAVTANAWNILGNTGTNANDNFLGTTDDVDLKFRVNNKQVGWFTTQSSTNANSVFLGQGAGAGSATSHDAVFIGYGSGKGASEADNSNFIGQSAGSMAINANSSNFIGAGAGIEATYANNSNFFGTSAGLHASSADNSIFIGKNTGSGATTARYSVFLGADAGIGALNASTAIFIGQSAGYQAEYGEGGIFMGTSAGALATNAAASIFIGENAGYTATNANHSNFIGQDAGSDATNASISNFFGLEAGSGATDARYSTFIGNSAGKGATKAANSIFIGDKAGNNDLITDASTQSILIGNSTSTGGFINSIGLGTGATNTAVNQLMIGNSAGTLYDIVNPKYPKTRDDSGTTPPVNFLYTDDKGMFLSAPASGLAIEPWQIQGGILKATANTDAIYQNGSVAIGIASGASIPAAEVMAHSPKLYVDGNVSTTGSFYTTNSVYADYVFEKYFNGSSAIDADYKFKSLNEIEAFIKANKHLPGVTPITEVNKTKNGYSIDMTKLTVQSLEKIEELYLHVLEMNTKMTAKDQEIKTLQEKTKALEERLDNLTKLIEKK